MRLFCCCFLRALQEAQELFGVDFDFEEFDQYGDVYDDADDDDEDVRELLASCHEIHNIFAHYFAC